MSREDILGTWRFFDSPPLLYYRKMAANHPERPNLPAGQAGVSEGAKGYLIPSYEF